jgi:hypothetical protein
MIPTGVRGRREDAESKKLISANLLRYEECHGQRRR